MGLRSNWKVVKKGLVDKKDKYKEIIQPVEHIEKGLKIIKLRVSEFGT